MYVAKYSVSACSCCDVDGDDVSRVGFCAGQHSTIIESSCKAANVVLQMTLSVRLGCPELTHKYTRQFVMIADNANGQHVLVQVLNRNFLAVPTKHTNSMAMAIFCQCLSYQLQSAGTPLTCHDRMSNLTVAKSISYN